MCLCSKFIYKLNVRGRQSVHKRQILNNYSYEYQEHMDCEEVNVPILRGRTEARTDTSRFKAASRCCAAIFSRASRSISCSHSRSLRRRTCE